MSSQFNIQFPEDLQFMVRQLAVRYQVKAGDVLALAFSEYLANHAQQLGVDLNHDLKPVEPSAREEPAKDKIEGAIKSVEKTINETLGAMNNPALLQQEARLQSLLNRFSGKRSGTD